MFLDCTRIVANNNRSVLRHKRDRIISSFRALFYFKLVNCACATRVIAVNDKNTKFLFIVSLKTMKREEKGNELPPSFRSHSLLTVLNQVHMHGNEDRKQHINYCSYSKYDHKTKKNFLNQIILNIIQKIM